MRQYKAAQSVDWAKVLSLCFSSRSSLVPLGIRPHRRLLRLQGLPPSP